MPPEANKAKLLSPSELKQREDKVAADANAAAEALEQARKAESETTSKHADDPDSDAAREAVAAARKSTEEALLKKSGAENYLAYIRESNANAEKLFNGVNAAAEAALQTAGADAGRRDEVLEKMRESIEAVPPGKFWTMAELSKMAADAVRGDDAPPPPDDAPDPQDVPGGAKPGGDPDEAVRATALARVNPREKPDWVDGTFGTEPKDEAPPNSDKARELENQMDAAFRSLTAEASQRAGLPTPQSRVGGLDAVVMLEAGGQ